MDKEMVAAAAMAATSDRWWRRTARLPAAGSATVLIHGADAPFPLRSLTGLSFVVVVAAAFSSNARSHSLTRSLATHSIDYCQPECAPQTSSPFVPLCFCLCLSVVLVGDEVGAAAVAAAQQVAYSTLRLWRQR